MATHSSTLEFTKETFVTKTGNCILGINATFDPQKLKDFVQKHTSCTLHISCNNYVDTITCKIHPNFSHHEELVIRKSNYLSDRTFGIHSDKAAIDIKRAIVSFLQKSENKATITLLI